MIESDDIFLAMTIVTMMMVILSIPSILITVRNSSKQLKRYKTLRSMNDLGNKPIPQHIVNEWNAVKSPIGYTTLITEEIERLDGIRPAIFQTEIAFVLIIFMTFVPGYSSDIFWIMIVLLIVIIVTVIYGSLNIKMYTLEYLAILQELSNNGEESRDNMYG